MDTVNVCVPDWHKSESYARIALELTKAWQKAGRHVNTLGLRAPNSSIHPVMGGICMAYPTNFDMWGTMPMAGPRVAVTMFESTKLPNGWAEALNACAAVVVPSTWLVNVFREAGVTRPIHVVPLGISKAFKPVQRDIKAQVTTFLCIGDRGKRKGWHWAALSFNKAFGDDMRYRLIIKNRPGTMGFRIQNPNVEHIEADLSDKKLAELYCRADCMIFPAMGEGFGFPPREFAATGGISLATDWGGTADDLQHWGKPIPVGRMVPAWEDDGGDHAGLGQWAEPNLAHLEGLLKNVAEFRAGHLLEAYRRAPDVHARYSWQSFADRVWKIWTEVRDGNAHAN